MGGSDRLYDLTGGVVSPRWLTPRSSRDVEATLDRYRAFVGRPRRELDEALRSLPAQTLDRAGAGLVHRVLDESFRSRAPRNPSARQVRSALYLAAGEHSRRGDAVARAARELGLSPEEVERTMFGDVASERLVVMADEPPCAAEVIEQANLVLTQRLLRRAEWLRVHVRGDTRSVIQATRCARLLAEIEEGGERGWLRIALSGPLSLHRRTTMYGHALARFLPALARCREWQLQARLALPEGQGVLRCSQRDPLLRSPGRRPRFDSRTEERFFRDFQRATTAWELLREPAPLRSGSGWIFPDFLARHPDGAGVWIEIVGFWTPGYLRRKLDRVRAAAPGRWILCVNDALALDAEDAPAHARITRFKRRIDVAAVVDLLEKSAREPRADRGHDGLDPSLHMTVPPERAGGRNVPSGAVACRGVEAAM